MYDWLSVCCVYYCVVSSNRLLFFCVEYVVGRIQSSSAFARSALVHWCWTTSWNSGVVSEIVSCIQVQLCIISFGRRYSRRAFEFFFLRFVGCVLDVWFSIRSDCSRHWSRAYINSSQLHLLNRYTKAIHVNRWLKKKSIWILIESINPLTRQSSFALRGVVWIQQFSTATKKNNFAH